MMNKVTRHDYKDDYVYVRRVEGVDDCFVQLLDDRGRQAEDEVRMTRDELDALIASLQDVLNDWPATDPNACLDTDIPF